MDRWKKNQAHKLSLRRDVTLRQKLLLFPGIADMLAARKHAKGALQSNKLLFGNKRKMRVWDLPAVTCSYCGLSIRDDDHDKSQQPRRYRDSNKSDHDGSIRIGKAADKTFLGGTSAETCISCLTR